MNSREGGPLNVEAFLNNADLDDEVEITREQYQAMIQQAIDELERKGLVYDTGLRRNGQIVYAATPSSSEYN